MLPPTEPPEPPPKTYTVKNKFEYFKPTVQVEMDNPDKQDTVTELYIRGTALFSRDNIWASFKYTVYVNIFLTV